MNIHNKIDNKRTAPLMLASVEFLINGYTPLQTLLPAKNFRSRPHTSRSSHPPSDRASPYTPGLPSPAHSRPVTETILTLTSTRNDVSPRSLPPRPLCGTCTEVALSSLAVGSLAILSL